MNHAENQKGLQSIAQLVKISPGSTILLRGHADGSQARQIRETQMDAERAVLEKQHLLQQSDMAAQIQLESDRRNLVSLATANARTEADARAYGIAATMQALAAADPRVIQALASTGMKPEQLIAAAFQDLAGKAERIGQLNVSPDLLRELMDREGGR